MTRHAKIITCHDYRLLGYACAGYRSSSRDLQNGNLDTVLVIILLAKLF